MREVVVGGVGTAIVQENIQYPLLSVCNPRTCGWISRTFVDARPVLPVLSRQVNPSLDGWTICPHGEWI
ncbi:hypothetical protein [Trichothermofontia sp.]